MHNTTTDYTYWKERAEKLQSALESLRDVTDTPPPADCQCHCSPPPCYDCVENGLLREIVQEVDNLLKKED